MLSGSNTNVRYKGVTFHVQTEDSGRAHPHVITHLFHGGNIMASEKRAYEDLLLADDLEARLKMRMDEQHTAMVQRLRSGALDAVIRERLGGTALADSDPATEGAATAPPAPPEAAEASPERQRPLDEVVLEYLLESARQRAK